MIGAVPPAIPQLPSSNSNRWCIGCIGEGWDNKEGYVVRLGTDSRNPESIGTLPCQIVLASEAVLAILINDDPRKLITQSSPHSLAQVSNRSGPTIKIREVGCDGPRYHMNTIGCPPLTSPSQRLDVESTNDLSPPRSLDASHAEPVEILGEPEANLTNDEHKINLSLKGESGVHAANNTVENIWCLNRYSKPLLINLKRWCLRLADRGWLDLRHTTLVHIEANHHRKG